MKVKQHGPRMEELRRKGATYQEIGDKVNLTREQVKEYFRRDRREQRQRGYSRSKKSDAQKTNQTLRGELKSLRMELDLLRDFMDVWEGG
jgi:hypothetical protein